MKSREDRERELQRLADTDAGCEAIRRIWNKVKGIPEGMGFIGTLVRQEMIPDILRHEYPNN
jgi:hypothetical protein